MLKTNLRNAQQSVMLDLSPLNPKSPMKLLQKRRRPLARKIHKPRKHPRKKRLNKSKLLLKRRPLARKILKPRKYLRLLVMKR